MLLCVVILVVLPCLVDRLKTTISHQRLGHGSALLKAIKMCFRLQFATRCFTARPSNVSCDEAKKGL